MTRQLEKTRIISFRLPKSYIDLMERICREEGIDRISDYSRTAVLNALKHEQNVVPLTEARRMRRLLSAIDEMRSQIDHLRQLLDEEEAEQKKTEAKRAGAGK